MNALERPGGGERDGGLPFEVGPASPAGRRLVELAEAHAAEFWTRADRHDREGTFPFENWEAMRESGFLTGCVAEEQGGLGLAPVSDLLVAVGRLARGDGSTAIGATMHLVALWYFSWRFARAREVGDEALARQVRRLLRLAAGGRAIACVAISEAGTSLGWPKTTATPAGGGYRVSGRKTFCTNSPVGTLFLSSVRIQADGADDRLGFALVPRGTPGLEVQANWDALGMRASGSNDVVYDDCLLPRQMVMAAGPLGVLSAELLPMVTVGALCLAGAALGIAERAQALVVESATTRRSGPARRLVAERHAIQTLVAESEVDLAAGRAVLARTAWLLDEGLGGGGELQARHLDRLMAQVQCAALTAKRGAIAVVDRALTASGGGGYLSRNPLSRLYRDVRAGPFMQPFSPLEAFEYIGRVTLGLDLALDV